MDPLLLRAVTGRPIRFLAKNTFWNNPFGRAAMDAFGTLKVYRQQDLAGEVAKSDDGAAMAPAPATRDRNEETFARCRAELAAGAELALYPEGMSHSEPRLKPLKSGASRIALSAAAEAVALGGAIPALIPVASHYEDKENFRTGVLIVIGTAIDMTAAQATFAADARQGIDELTALMRARLEALVLQAETHALLEGVARLTVPPTTGPNHDEDHARTAHTRALLEGYARLKLADPLRLEELARPARRHARLLERLDVDDPWAVELPLVSRAAAGKALARAVLLAPAGVWGLVTSWPSYRLASIVARRMTRDDDLLATTKMITGAAFLTGTWLLEAVVIGVCAGPGWGLGSFVIAPLAAYAAVRLREALRGLSEVLRHLGWRSRAATAQRLTERRQHLAEHLARALREAGS